MAASVAPPPLVTQEPLRLGLGVVALVFYLWLIHSYKLASGDLAVLGLALGVLFRGETIRVPGPLRVFLVFIVWSAFGLGVTANFGITQGAIISLVKLWIISFCVVNVVRTPAELRFLVIAWLALYALYPVRGAFFNQYICQCTEFGRVGWNFIFENPNDLAALSFIPLGLAAGTAVVERVKLFKWAAIAGVAVLGLLVMLTQSRGAILALGVAAMVLPLTSRRKGRDFMLLLLLMGAAAIVAPKDVWQRVAGLGNASVSGNMAGVDPEGSAEARWQIWKIAAGTVATHPLMGVGVGMMPLTNRWEALRLGKGYSVMGSRDTHSTFLRIAAETGYPGLLLYLGIWLSVFLHVRRVRRGLRDRRPKEYQFLFFMELAMISFTVASIFGTYGAISFTYLGICVAWLSATILEKQPWYVPASAAEAAPVGMLAGARRR